MIPLFPIETTTIPTNTAATIAKPIRSAIGADASLIACQPSPCQPSKHGPGVDANQTAANPTTMAAGQSFARRVTTQPAAASATTADDAYSATRSIVSPGSASRYADGGRTLNVGRRTLGYSPSTSSGKSTKCQTAGSAIKPSTIQGQKRRVVDRAGSSFIRKCPPWRADGIAIGGQGKRRTELKGFARFASG